ncbi:hypothetical protein HDU97_001897 [Phlyctochytrium planicorne]|nr:hypothetical protein HDU97_001897 [Phlyctochytrium planicorne]
MEPKRFVLPTFLLVGDSLTQFSSNPAESGWSAMLQNAYIRSVDVVNRGFMGTNDASTTPPQRVPLETYEQNLQTLLTTTKHLHPSLKILLITPPPPDVSQLDIPNRDFHNTKKYRTTCLRVGDWAKTLWGRDVAVLDSWSALGVDATMSEDVASRRLQSLLRDGLHFSSRGNAKIGQAVLDTIANAWEELRPERLPWGYLESYQGQVEVLVKAAKQESGVGSLRVTGYGFAVAAVVSTLFWISIW